LSNAAGAQIHDVQVAAECGMVVDGPDNSVAVEQKIR